MSSISAYRVTGTSSGVDRTVLHQFSGLNGTVTTLLQKTTTIINGTSFPIKDSTEQQKKRHCNRNYPETTELNGSSTAERRQNCNTAGSVSAAAAVARTGTNSSIRSTSAAVLQPAGTGATLDGRASYPPTLSITSFTPASMCSASFAVEKKNDDSQIYILLSLQDTKFTNDLIWFRFHLHLSAVTC